MKFSCQFYYLFINFKIFIYQKLYFINFKVLKIIINFLLTKSKDIIIIKIYYNIYPYFYLIIFVNSVTYLLVLWDLYILKIIFYNIQNKIITDFLLLSKNKNRYYY